MYGVKDVGFKEKHWHERCFACAECKANLIDKPFSYRDNSLLCAVCYEKNPSVCAACQKPFHLGMIPYEQAWASTHGGKWGQLTPPGKWMKN